MTHGETFAKIDEHRRRKAIPDALIPDNEFGRLYREALDRYGATCLWNCRPQPTPEGVAVIADRLIKHGDLRAWHVAHRMLELCNDAA